MTLKYFYSLPHIFPDPFLFFFFIMKDLGRNGILLIQKKRKKKVRFGLKNIDLIFFENTTKQSKHITKKRFHKSTVSEEVEQSETILG